MFDIISFSMVRRLEERDDNGTKVGSVCLISV